MLYLLSWAGLTSREFIDLNGILEVRHRQRPVSANEPRVYAALDEHKAIQQQHQQKNEPRQCVGHHERPANGANETEQGNSQLMSQEQQAPIAEEPAVPHTTERLVSGTPCRSRSFEAGGARQASANR